MKALLVLLVGWIADLFIGDPERLPHPIVWFGKLIGWGERLLNRGCCRMFTGGLMTIVLIGAVYAGAYYLFEWIDSMSVRWGMVLKAIFVFYFNIMT